MSLDISLYIEDECVASFNITHNLNTMADKVGIYKALWRPEEINAIYAKDIISIIEKGLLVLESNPAYYREFDSSNGWGTYDQFIPFIKKVLESLIEYPESELHISR